MTSLEMPKFQNTLTLGSNTAPQEQNFVNIGQNDAQYCINCDSSLFYNLRHQSKKNEQEFVKEFPFIFEWSPEGWTDFWFQGMHYTYFHFAWVPSYNLV